MRFALKAGMGEAVEKAVVAVARFSINALYFACCALPRRDEAVFVSRQANEPSYDFKAIGREFERRGFRAVFLTRKLQKRTIVRYAFHAVREIYHLARCRICFVDRYDPVISLMNFQCEPQPASCDIPVGVYREFPVRPVVVQLWHAFGAFKCFGFQSHDTVEGHTSKAMELYRIHRNYSWVLCSGEGCRQAFARAFNCPVERVIALLRPGYDEFARLRTAAFAERGAGEESGLLVLFAPTLRKSSESRHPFRDLAQEGGWKNLSDVARIEWAFHPLEQEGVAAGTVNQTLLDASIVVTDYSSIAYEAYLLGKPVVFYVPDIDEYRASPGLNSDPLKLCPRIAFTDEWRLFAFLEDCLNDPELYPWDAFEAFAGSAIDECDGRAVDVLVEAAFGWLGRGRCE